MHWANFLHIFQPPHQLLDVLEKVVNESYRPLIAQFLATPGAKITLNINAGLSDLLVKNGYGDVILGITTLAERGQLEFLESAAFHAFLPLLPEGEVRRQIEINRQLNRGIFGEIYAPTGFFAPEMAFSQDLAKIVDSLGYKYFVVDEITFSKGEGDADFSRIYTIAQTKLKAVVRSRRLSNLIMGAVVRSGEGFVKALDPEQTNGYILTGMDGETFGHHRPGLDRFLFEIYTSPQMESVCVGELLKLVPPGGDKEMATCTWACNITDIKENRQFALWNDPQNEIHKLQWELVGLAIESVSLGDGAEPARSMLDRALDSGQFWWASASPWWSIEEIERGAWNLLQVTTAVDQAQKQAMRAKEIYREILEKVFTYQRTGQMRKTISDRRAILKIPLKESDVAEYKAAIEVMGREEKEAADRSEYEQAIKWRDAAFKLKNGLDIYDTVNIVDVLRAQNRHQDFEKILKRYKKEFQNLQKGQPE